MKPTLERLTEQFTQLIGPEAFAKAKAAQEAAAAAAAAAAKAAAEKAAAAAAKAAAEAAAKAAAAPASAVPVPTPAPAAASAGAGATGPASVPSGRAGTPLPANAGAERSPRPTAAAPAGSAAAAARPAVAAGAAVAPRPAPAVAPAAPAVPPPPPLPVQKTEHAAKGYDFDAIVAPDQVVLAAQLLDGEGFGLDAITGVDWIAQNEMEVVYDFFHPNEPIRVVVRTRVPRATPSLPTITPVFPGANWHEREAHDFFGLVFTGHPNLKPFLLPEDANFHPLRKDYQP